MHFGCARMMDIRDSGHSGNIDLRDRSSGWQSRMNPLVLGKVDCTHLRRS